MCRASPAVTPLSTTTFVVRCFRTRTNAPRSAALEGRTMFKADLCGRFRNVQMRLVLMAILMALALPILGIGLMRASAQNGTATATADACPPATPTSGTPTPTQCVEIGEFDIYYKPNLATLPADTAVRVVQVNHGVTIHNFSITDHKN